MSELLDKMDEYFKNTPKEKVQEDWKKSEKYDKVGITINKFINYLKLNKMTPKEKATELYEKMWLIKDEQEICSMNRFYAKQCALITVDEIINGNFGDGYNQQFWECVKEELLEL